MKANVIMAGIGGRGVMVAALSLARAAMKKYPHVTWLPSMTTAQRGGACEATVVFSDSPIASPLVWRPQAVVIMETSQLDPFIPRIIPNGLIVTEKAGLEKEVGRRDIKVLEIPAIEISLKVAGNTQSANLVLLGAYIRATKLIPPELVEEELRNTFSGKGEVLSSNINSFRQGYKIAES
jgi:2-oxoglutarate ferredoxin oxidoreductase subunit gamma